MTRNTDVRTLSLALLLAALVAAVFWPLGGYPFIGLDDPWYVFHNPRVLQGLTRDNLSWALTSLGQANWHPLTWISHMADVSLFGLDAGKHHLVNLALHIAATTTLFLLLAGMTGARVRSWLAAALFGVHPLHVESVAWVAERKDVLSGLFFMLVLASYLRFVRRGGRGRYGLVVGLYALGLTTKPMLMTLPLVLLLLDWWPLGRLGGRPASVAVPAARQARPVLEKIPLLLLAAASGAITYLAQQRGGAVNMMETHYLVDRAANALHSYALYLVDTVWPARLTVFYPFPDVRELPWQLAGSALLLAAISGAAFLLRKRQPFVAMGWCWYLGTLVPVIGLVKVGEQARADRYTYLPLIGLFVALIWAAHRLPAPRRWATVYSVTGPLLIVAALSVAARQQVELWRDDTTLFSHALEVNAEDWIAHYILGDALVKRKKVEEALDHFREAVRLNPGYAEAQNNLGLTLAMTGNREQAVGPLQEAIRLDPGRAGFAFNFANLLSSLGRTDEAERYHRRALELDPDLAEAHNNLGLLLCAGGEVSEALEHFAAAARIKPDFIQAKVNFRICLRNRAQLIQGGVPNP